MDDEICCLDVPEWLERRGLPVIASTLRTAGALCDVQEDDLVSLGVSHPLHRRRVLRELELLQVLRGSATGKSRSPSEERTPGLKSKASSSSLTEPASLSGHGDAVAHDLSCKGRGSASRDSTRPPSSSSLPLSNDSGLPAASALKSSDKDPRQPANVLPTYALCKDESVDPRGLSGKNARLSRRCVELRHQLSLERQSRSMAASENQFRVLRLSRECDSLQEELREAHRLRRAQERESRTLRARLRLMIMAAKADKESAMPESRQATSAEVDVSSPSPSLYRSMSASFASPDRKSVV